MGIVDYLKTHFFRNKKRGGFPFHMQKAKHKKLSEGREHDHHTNYHRRVYLDYSGVTVGKGTDIGDYHGCIKHITSWCL